MILQLQKFSHRFAEQALNNKLALKQEIENVLMDSNIDVPSLSRTQSKNTLKYRYINKGWKSQPSVFDEPNYPSVNMDFLKERTGIKVGFGHASFIGIDLIKFQMASYPAVNRIDVGAYIATTRNFQKLMKNRDYVQNWKGVLTFEKVVRYSQHSKSVIQVSMCVIGIDL
jgi:hypothetical protein